MTRTLIVWAILTLAFSPIAFAQYGDISDVKVAKPEDKQDVKSTPAPDGAIVLFDGKDLKQWVKADLQVVEGKGEAKPAHWTLVEGGAMQVKGGGNLMTKDNFAGPFKLHVEFRVPYE